MNEFKEQVWERSIAGIRQALPLRRKWGAHRYRECLEPAFSISTATTPRRIRSLTNISSYVDEIDSTWVGIYFDLSNHRKYSYGPDWIRAMGTRIVKIDTKDYLLAKDAKDGSKEGFCDIGEGSVDWEGTRKALLISTIRLDLQRSRRRNRERLADNLERMKKYIQGWVSAAALPRPIDIGQT